MRLDAPGGRIGHAEIEIGDSVVMLADPWPEAQFVAPRGEEVSVSIHLYVEDADAVVQRTIDLAREEQVVAVYHDFMETTAETVKKIVPQLLDKGYRFEPVPYPPETAKNL